MSPDTRDLRRRIAAAVDAEIEKARRKTMPPTKRKRAPWMTEEMLREATYQADKIQRRVEDIEEEMAEEVCRKLSNEFSITEKQARELLDEGW